MVQKMPRPLKQQFFARLGIGLVAITLFAIIQVLTKDFYLAVPVIVLAIFMIASGLFLFNSYKKGNILCVKCSCIYIERTKIKNRIKSIHVLTEKGVLQLFIRRKIKNLAVGDDLNIYISKKTAIYERAKQNVICDYCAIEKINFTEVGENR